MSTEEDKPSALLTAALSSHNLDNMNRNSSAGQERRRGNNIIEFTFLLPWYVFLFVGAMDMGVYSYALITVESAARVAALYCATSTATQADSANACIYALGQLHGLPNIPTTMVSTCSAPVTVTAVSWTGPDSAAGTAVTVTYVGPTLPTLSTYIPGSYTVTRTVRMKLRS